MTQLLHIFLMYVVLPVWLAAGVADWWTHRSSRIQETSGSFESILHIVLIVQMGIPIISAMFLEINAMFFILTGVALILHQITVYIDLNYASSRRYISPLEQMIHGIQEGVPYAAVMLLAILHWQQFMAIFGINDTLPIYTLTLRDHLPSIAYSAALLVAGTGVLSLFGEELIRCYSIKRHKLQLP